MKVAILGMICVAIQLSEGINELPRSCDANAICVGYYKGFNCSCNSGYKGSDLGCVNIDECVETPEVCTEIESCNDIIGSYNCTCGNIDVICHENAACLNESVDTVKCICDSGYTGNGTVCTDINECLLLTHNCSDHALCENTEGSYVCTCYLGYEGDGFTCKDIDECARETHDCVLPKTCNNTIGSFDCICGTDGFCDEHGYCAEFENATSCFCDSGYEGTGVECADIDECDESQQCHTHASCINTEGSFRCICDDPYEGDGFECSSAEIKVFSSLLVFLSLITSKIVSKW